MTEAPAGPWAARPPGVRLTVRLTPKSSRDGLGGLDLRDGARPALSARVRAAPEDGKANEALTKLLARELDVAAGAVRLVSGGSGRVKTFDIAGDADRLDARLRAITAANGQAVTAQRGGKTPR